MKAIGLYGKGGIGKSTVATNLCAEFATRGKVLLVGCDPKHDTSRNILQEQRAKTILGQLLRKSMDDLEPEDFLQTGYAGIDCVEVGGPKPGEGCGGRGVIKMFDVLADQEILERGYDYTVCDVLGDVVCGGFAVPMRSGFCEEVYLVASGELMSLYAANNICRGLKNISRNTAVHVGGIIANVKRPERDVGIVEKLAETLGTQLVHVIPWSDSVREAERLKKTVIEHAPDSDQAAVYRELARKIEANTHRVLPEPMSDEGFEDFLGRAYAA